LQQLNKHALKDNRFTVVGQSTKGGAHPMTGFPLMDAGTREINNDYFLWTPDRNSENVYTHTNWEDGPKAEGKKPGVQPDFEISKNQDALQVAIESIQRKAELQSSVGNRSSTAFMISLSNFGSTVTAPPEPSYALSKQQNILPSENTAQSNNASSSIEEKSDQSTTNPAKSPFKNLSGTPRFNKGD
jgi:hypothetical protein